MSYKMIDNAEDFLWENAGFLPEIAEENEDGFADEPDILAEVVTTDPDTGELKLFFSEENKAAWKKITEKTLAEAQRAYKKNYPGAAFKHSAAAGIWSMGYQIAGIKFRAKDYFGLSELPDSWEGQLMDAIISLQKDIFY